MVNGWKIAISNVIIAMTIHIIEKKGRYKGMHKKKLALAGLAVGLILGLSALAVTGYGKGLGSAHEATGVVLEYEDIITEETIVVDEEREIELVVSAEEETTVEEEEVIEESGVAEDFLVVEESEAIEEEPIVEEIKSIYTDVSYNMYAKMSLNIRQGLGADTAKIGSLTQNQEVTVIGEVSDSDWVLISYGNGNEGHVNKSYLSDTKTVVASTPKTNNNQGTGSSTDNSSQASQPTDNSSANSGSSSNSNSDFSAILDAIEQGGTKDGTSTGGYIGDFVP